MTMPAICTLYIGKDQRAVCHVRIIARVLLNSAAYSIAVHADFADGQRQDLAGRSRQRNLLQAVAVSSIYAAALAAAAAHEPVV